MKTRSTRSKDIIRGWHKIDVSGKVLGRISTEIAVLLSGKNKPYFVRNLDCGDYVVVVNAKDIQVTGKKTTMKQYTDYSGYPGGLKKRTYEELKAEDSTEVIRRAVEGMLPDNTMKDQLMKRLYIFPDATHKFTDKFIS